MGDTLIARSSFYVFAGTCATSLACGINAANIVVRARSGAVTLEGNVPTQDELSRAEEVAKGVSGVNSVNNALTIRQPGQ